MQAGPTNRFLVLETATQVIEALRGAVGRVERRDRDLADQLRRALSSVALNVAEGNRSLGGNRGARFATAAGSASEARTALRVAVAWGYLEEGELDRAGGMLYRLRGLR